MGALRILISFLLISNAYAELEIPKSYSATYGIYKGLFKLGTMQRRLEIDSDGKYVFESVMETRGVVALFARNRVVEKSRGRVTNQQFLPESYEYIKLDSSRNYSLIFDYESGLVRRLDSKANWKADMPHKLLDKLVYQAQITFDLSRRPRSLYYNVVGRKKLKKYEIKNLGEEKIQTKFGEFEAFKLQRSKNNSKKRTTVWYANELDWLPIKVEHRDGDGNVTTASLLSVTFL
jgi:hypothetical protein